MGNNFLDKLPAELQDAVIEHRKNQMQNTEITWTGIGDCPFWPKRLAVEYRALTANWYHTMFRIMVSVACSAIKREYPITPQEIAKLVKEFDEATGNWYKDRPLELEATSAIRYAYANGKI